MLKHHAAITRIREIFRQIMKNCRLPTYRRALDSCTKSRGRVDNRVKKMKIRAVRCQLSSRSWWTAAIADTWENGVNDHSPMTQRTMASVNERLICVPYLAMSAPSFCGPTKYADTYSYPVVLGRQYVGEHQPNDPNEVDPPPLMGSCRKLIEGMNGEENTIRILLLSAATLYPEDRCYRGRNAR